MQNQQVQADLARILGGSKGAPSRRPGAVLSASVPKDAAAIAGCVSIVQIAEQLEQGRELLQNLESYTTKATAALQERAKEHA